jgi:hypothetical protein
MREAASVAGQSGAAVFLCLAAGRAGPVRHWQLRALTGLRQSPSAVGVPAAAVTAFLALAFLCVSVTYLYVLLAMAAAEADAAGEGGEEEAQGAGSVRAAADERRRTSLRHRH